MFKPLPLLVFVLVTHSSFGDEHELPANLNDSWLFSVVTMEFISKAMW